MLVIESVDNPETEWLVSWGGCNPTASECVQCASKKAAFATKEAICKSVGREIIREFRHIADSGSNESWRSMMESALYEVCKA